MAPDGAGISRGEWRRAIAFLRNADALTDRRGFDSLRGVKLLLLGCALATLATACTTLPNRRDLYNPSEDAGPYNSLPPAHPHLSPTPGREPLQPAPQ